MFGLGTQEIILILIVILILFGGKKIPEMMRGLGAGVRSFKDGMNGIEEQQDNKKEQTGKNTDNNKE